jgi:hypothetical protein
MQYFQKPENALKRAHGEDICVATLLLGLFV